MNKDNAMRLAIEFNAKHGLDANNGARVVAFMTKASKYRDAIGTFRVQYPPLQHKQKPKNDKVHKKT